MASDGLTGVIRADPNDAEDFDVTAEALDAGLAERRRRVGGRPRGANSSNKSSVTLRIDNDVLARWRASGAGWQSRINEALRKVAP